MIITCIDWDADAETKALLPTEVEVPDELEDDEVAGYLSDVFENCVTGFVIENES